MHHTTYRVYLSSVEQIISVPYYASLTDVGKKTTVDGLKMDVPSPSKVEAKHKPLYVGVCLFLWVCVGCIYVRVCVMCVTTMFTLFSLKQNDVHIFNLACRSLTHINPPLFPWIESNLELLSH